MKNNFLPLALALLFLNLANAQELVSIPLKSSNPVQIQLDGSCNDAGTIEVGQFIGQSNDTDLYQIFLCLGDSILIDHQGDADLSGDPIPSTVPGIGYGFYSCPPTVSGPTFGDVIGDPCILQGAAFGLYVTQGVPNDGDTWFFNNGFLQSTFNLGQPLSLFFAPLTLDDFASNTYEAVFPGTPPGPCVDVNLDEAFEVVYLNNIAASGISNNFGDDCIGRFTSFNGYPQWDPLGVYSIDVSLASDPAVKAQVMTTQSNILHLASVLFSATQAGVYNIAIEDGKSCGHQFQMNMGGCNSSDNVRLDFDKVAGELGEVVCVPLRVENFDIASGSFSVTWDPNLLKFKDITNFHPAISTFFDLDTFVNIAVVNTGNLGVALYNSWSLGAPISIPDGEAVFEVCFEVLDTTDLNCIPITISNALSQVFMEDPFGQTKAVTVLPGGICKPVATSELGDLEISKIFPNPVKAGEPTYLNLVARESIMGQLIISNAQGARVQAKEVELAAGENRIALPTTSLLPGIYFATVSGSNEVLAAIKWWFYERLSPIVALELNVLFSNKRNHTLYFYPHV